MKRTAKERRYARGLQKLRDAYHFAPKGEKKRRQIELQSYTTAELKREVGGV